MTLTKEEQIQAIYDLKVGYTLGNADIAILKSMARQLLASMERKPVAYMIGGYYLMHAHDPKVDNYASAEPLYTAPPAPVSVPDDRYQHLSELYHAQEKRLFKLAQRIKGPSLDKYAYSTSQAIDVLETAIFGEKEDNVSECSAAMLQGAAGNSPAIPNGWVACSERMPSIGEKVLAYRPDAPESNDPLIKMAKYVGKSAHGHGFDCYCKPSHWMPLPAAPQQEAQ